jgi:hypothetical protein
MRLWFWYLLSLLGPGALALLSPLLFPSPPLLPLLLMMVGSS